MAIKQKIISSPDINECQLDIDNCDQHATCTNTEGSYSCACNAGWTGDGFTCEGINNMFRVSFHSILYTNPWPLNKKSFLLKISTNANLILITAISKQLALILRDHTHALVTPVGQGMGSLVEVLIRCIFLMKYIFCINFVSCLYFLQRKLYF